MDKLLVIRINSSLPKHFPIQRIGNIIGRQYSWF